MLAVPAWCVLLDLPMTTILSRLRKQKD